MKTTKLRRTCQDSLAPHRKLARPATTAGLEPCAARLPQLAKISSGRQFRGRASRGAAISLPIYLSFDALELHGVV